MQLRLQHPFNGCTRRNHSANTEELNCPKSQLRYFGAFIELVRQRLPEDLDGWLAKAAKSSIKVFQTFAKGLKEDYDAVKAALTLEVSNGPVEGLNNRLKMLKRQMFSRTGLDLLAKRFILTS